MNIQIIKEVIENLLKLKEHPWLLSGIIGLIIGLLLNKNFSFISPLESSSAQIPVDKQVEELFSKTDPSDNILNSRLIEKGFYQVTPILTLLNNQFTQEQSQQASISHSDWKQLGTSKLNTELTSFNYYHLLDGKQFETYREFKEQFKLDEHHPIIKEMEKLIETDYEVREIKLEIVENDTYNKGEASACKTSKYEPYSYVSLRLPSRLDSEGINVKIVEQTNCYENNTACHSKILPGKSIIRIRRKEAENLVRDHSNSEVNPSFPGGCVIAKASISDNRSIDSSFGR